MAATTNQFAVQEVARRDSVAKQNTGFPEPLSADRNTTLHHPDADTSNNAAIEAKDVPLERTHSRRSFLHKHGRNSSSLSGKLTPEKLETRYEQ